MHRVIKRYENRKLYDTVDKRYVSLPDLARMVRQGDEVAVLDNATGEDLTAGTLTKIILEEGAQTQTWLTPQFLHELVRSGGKAVAGGVGKLQHGLDGFLRASLDRVAHVREIRQEVSGLKERLEHLEKQISELEEQHGNDTDRSTE
jgi:polyhydroxyalkanoate synthesis repressor PhaR